MSGGYNNVLGGKCSGGKCPGVSDLGVYVS